MPRVGRTPTERAGQALLVFLILFGWEYFRGSTSWRIPLVVAVAFFVITAAIDGARRKLRE